MSSSAALRILPCGDAALTVEFGDTVDPFLNALVLGLDDALKAHTVPGLQETIPTYRSLFVTYDPVTTDFAAISGVLRELAQQAGPRPNRRAAGGCRWSMARISALISKMSPRAKV